VDGAGYFKTILATVGVFADPALIEKLIDRDLASWSAVNPETEKLIGDLKQAGLKTAVLSNMVRDFADRVKGTLPVFGIPDVIVFSCDVDAVKPEEKIYRILLSRLGCGAEELVFFDDVEANVEGARKLGITALSWKGPEEARKELAVLCAERF
jgi:putative hydrolase of the HAD superfamily